MSWDVVLINLPEGTASVADLPKDHISAPLGRRAEVEEAIRRAVPGVDLTDPTWGDVNGPGWSMELNIGSKDPIEDIMLHIRGSSDWVFEPIFALARELQCQVIDCGSGDVLSEGESGTWHEWKAFRDRMPGFRTGFTAN